jgi:hypothetical protein
MVNTFTFITVFLATITVVWNIWRQSHPIARVRVETTAGFADDPWPDRLTFKVSNTGAVPVTISGLALVVHSNALCQLIGIRWFWHNLVRRGRGGVKLPKLLAVGEEWTGTVQLDDKLLEHLGNNELFYEASLSYRRRPITGKIQRQNALDLLRA